MKLIETLIGRVAEKPLNIRDTGVTALLDDGRFFYDKAEDGAVSGVPSDLLAMAELLGYAPLTLEEHCRLVDWLETNPKEGATLKESIFTDPGFLREGVLAEIVGSTLYPDKSELHIAHAANWDYKGIKWVFTKISERTVTINANNPLQRKTPDQYILFNTPNNGVFPGEHVPDGKYKLIYPRGTRKNEYNALCYTTGNPKRISADSEITAEPSEWGEFTIILKEKKLNQ